MGLDGRDGLGGLDTESPLAKPLKLIPQSAKPTVNLPSCTLCLQHSHWGGDRLLGAGRIFFLAILPPTYYPVCCSIPCHHSY